MCVCVCVLVTLSCLTFCDHVDWALQAPLSIGLFCRQEYWSGLPFPSSGDLPDPVIEPGSPALQADSLTMWATRDTLVCICGGVCVYIYIYIYIHIHMASLVHVCMYIYVYSFLGGSNGRETACNAEDPSLIPGPGTSPGVGNGSPLQYSCLEIPMYRGA